jgi:hypothetical protein
MKLDRSQIDHNWAARHRPWLDTNVGGSFVTLGDPCVICRCRGKVVPDNTCWSAPIAWIDCPHCNGEGRINLRDVPSDVKARLTKEQWKSLDKACKKGFEYKSPLTQLLRGYCEFILETPVALNTTKMPERGDGMGVPDVLEHKVLIDQGKDAPDKGVTLGDFSYQVRGLPLPFTHCDFNMNGKSIAFQDWIAAEAAARRVGETVDRTVIGITDDKVRTQGHGYSQDTQVYGLLNHPHATKLPAWPKDIADIRCDDWDEVVRKAPVIVLGGIMQLQQNRCYGPYLLLTHRDDDRWLDCDWPHPNGAPLTFTVRGYLEQTEGVVRVTDGGDSWPKDTAAMVQVTPDVVRIVVGLEPVVLQWDDGFKFVTITVPQVRTDFHGNAGIVVWR